MATVDKLLDAAESRMRHTGYHAVSFRDLAADLGIKSASVHYHFPQKQDLAVSLVDRYSERFFEGLDARAVEPQSPKSGLSAFIDAYRSALGQDNTLCLCVMLGSENCGLPDEVVVGVAAFFERNIEWLCAVLRGSYPARRRKKTAVQVLATLQGAMVLASTLNDSAHFESAVAGLIDNLALD